MKRVDRYSLVGRDGLEDWGGGRRETRGGGTVSDTDPQSVLHLMRRDGGPHHTEQGGMRGGGKGTRAGMKRWRRTVSG